MQLFILHFPPLPHDIVPFMHKHLTQTPVLEHPQPIFLPFIHNSKSIK